MLPFGRAGVQILEAGPAFARPSEPLYGNQLPPWTGSHTGPADKPAPSPRSPGYVVGGQTGDYDGFGGTDPGSPGGYLPANPRVDINGAEQENARRYGIQGFNDRLQVRDRHAYWDAGTQRSGIDGVPHGLPNTYNPDIAVNRARPDLNTVNISVNPQIGSDHTAFEDDLSRPYTWLGQNDGTVVPVYGGVPGLYVPYGSRGGVPYAIVDPTGGEGGLENVWSGPPHGLHSDTLPDGKQLIDRYKATPQMRPVRIDRPDNSRIAGQSFSQTVRRQGEAPSGESPRRNSGLSFRVTGRGWSGEANR